MAFLINSKKREGITPEIVRHKFSYDPESGEIRWKNPSSNQCRAGDLAGSVDKGRRRIKIGEDLFPSTHIIWLYVHGVWPDREIDHADRNTLNDRLGNLRAAEPFQNGGNRGKNRNSTTGLRGVHIHPQRRGRWKWWAKIDVAGHRYDLGVFPEKEMAAAAYRIASSGMRGEFRGEF